MTSSLSWKTTRANADATLLATRATTSFMFLIHTRVSVSAQIFTWQRTVPDHSTCGIHGLAHARVAGTPGNFVRQVLVVSNILVDT